MKNFWKYLVLSPVLCGSFLLVNNVAAAESVKTDNSSRLAQTTSIRELSDVKPTDWAFGALQSLMERYRCMSGYPDNTYRGNRTLTRYEFAAALNACLNSINELIAQSTRNGVTREDLAALQRLEEEFTAELLTLRGRVDALETSTAKLQSNQFSTTSKLQGQVVGVMSDVIEGDGTEKNTTLGLRARVELVTSFTGKDTLFTRIAANNIPSPNINTREGNLFFVGGTDTSAAIDALYYKFPLNNKTQVIAIANAGAADDVTSTVNIFDGDGAFGALSTFGTRNPIYNQIGGTGIGVNHQLSNSLGISLAYLSPDANNQSEESGLFDGRYGALAQLTVKPSDRITLGLTYINSYKQPLLTGSNNATIAFDGKDFSSDSYGLQTSIGVSDKLIVGGWAGYTKSSLLTGTKGEVDIWNYALTVGFPDLGKKGNLGGIIAGVEPKVTSSNIAAPSKDANTSYHIEAFYQYKVNDHVTLTPGIIWLTAPDHNDKNASAVIGALRTTFSF